MYCYMYQSVDDMVVSTVQLDCCAITFFVSVYISNISPCAIPIYLLPAAAAVVWGPSSS